MQDQINVREDGTVDIDADISQEKKRSAPKTQNTPVEELEELNDTVTTPDSSKFDSLISNKSDFVSTMESLKDSSYFPIEDEDIEGAFVRASFRNPIVPTLPHSQKPVSPQMRRHFLLLDGLFSRNQVKIHSPNFMQLTTAATRKHGSYPNHIPIAPLLFRLTIS